jgi:predicted TIM-barrel fold metal-dependent hydrolase
VRPSPNDYLAAAIGRHPGRFAGFATLPTPDPAASVSELTRAVRELGFVGASINGHTLGRYLDDEFFWPILECAQELGVPIYLHPAVPPASVVEQVYSGNLSAQVAQRFASGGWGWHIETAQHLIRMILSGVFDRFPGLQIMVGHFGEALPFMMGRLELVFPPQLTGLNRQVGDYLRDNVYYTFSGFTWTPPFLDLLLQVGADRILFSADYPYAKLADATVFLASAPVSDADREKIAHGNAERLLDL